MKRRCFIIFSLIIIVLLSMTFISAVSFNQSRIDKAYQCLENNVKGKCSTLTVEQQTFAILGLESTGSTKDECVQALLDNSQDSGKCWPKSSCNIKTTAQAVLALSEVGQNTDKAEKWLLSQNKTPSDLNWFLEIESPETTTCKIKYSGRENTIQILADKTLSSGAGSCLTLESGNPYWLKISPSCYDQEFTVNCDKQFLTTLLYTKQASSTVFVSSEVHGSSSNAETKEKIQTLCFSQGGSCNYEGSLWAAFVLNKNYDVNIFIPYLTAQADNFNSLLPESFLFFLTNSPDYESTILKEQKENKYWKQSNDQLYDTALVMLMLQKQDNPTLKGNVNDYLINEAQDANGCWNNNIRDTGFILYSLFPGQNGGQTPISPNPNTQDCETSGFTCSTRTECEGASGTIKKNYDCSGSLVCCSNSGIKKSCSDLNGQVCTQGTQCSITEITASDTNKCCTGDCQQVQVQSQCEIAKGTCRTTQCTDTEQANTALSCDLTTQTCCVKKSTTTSGSKLWIWILFFLIILVLIGIAFRNKLRELLFRAKGPGSNTMNRPSTFQGPRFPPTSPPGRPIPRRILPPQSTQRRPIEKPSSLQKDFDETLKKLKDMGK